MIDETNIIRAEIAIGRLVGYDGDPNCVAVDEGIVRNALEEASRSGAMLMAFWIGFGEALRRRELEKEIARLEAKSEAAYAKSAKGPAWSYEHQMNLGDRFAAVANALQATLPRNRDDEEIESE